MAQGISIHCFDIARGVAAQGLRVVVSAADGRLICEGRAGQDASVAEPALMQAFEPGEYEIAFHVADYFRAAGLALPTVPFIDAARYRFRVGSRGTHYHFPFKMTPTGYSLFVTMSD
jgi:5-hydroxyisourate hydrolase